MKRLVFFSRSQLAQHLVELVLPLVSLKIEYFACSDPASLGKTALTKPAQLVLIDANILANDTESLWQALDHPSLRNAKKALLLGRDDDPDSNLLAQHGITAKHRKPFLDEELSEIIRSHLGRSSA